MDSELASGELIYYSHNLGKELKSLKLAPTSDVHRGHPLFSLHHFNEHLAVIRNQPDVFTILNGDLCESAVKSSKGNVYKQIGTPQDQRDWVIEKFYPMRHKVLGVTMGNHEMRIYNDTGVDICKDIAVALGAPYRPEGMLLKISFGGGNSYHEDAPYVYFIYFTHGFGGARTKSSKAVKVERLATYIHADVYLMSHDHVVNVAPDIYLIPDKRTHYDSNKKFNIGKIHAHRKMLVKTNAFILFGDYSESLGYPPVDLVTPMITFMGEGKPRVKVTV
jgi:hypothetical protein